jgi:hypothetical protein
MQFDIPTLKADAVSAAFFKSFTFLFFPSRYLCPPCHYSAMGSTLLSATDIPREKTTRKQWSMRPSKW